MDKSAVQGCATTLGIVSQLYATRLGTLLECHDITLGQFGILNHLARQDDGPAQRISDIADAVEVHQPAVTKTIARFEVLGIVTLNTDSKDKRAKRVQITGKGKALMEEIYASLGPQMSGMFDAFDPDMLQAFTKSLQHVATWLDENRI